MAGMYDLSGGPSAAASDPTQMMQRWMMLRALGGQQGQQQGGMTSPVGAFSSGLMSAMLMDPQAGAKMKTGLGNLFSGATGSMIGQYVNPYGGAGNGMGAMVGPGGMNGGGT